MVRNMERGSLDGQMVAATKAILIITRFAVKVFTLGRIVGLTKGVGSTTRWMDLAFSLGLMEKCIKGNTRMIISTVMESLYGQTVKSMTDCGEKEFNTGKESVLFQTIRR